MTIQTRMTRQQVQMIALSLLLGAGIAAATTVLYFRLFGDDESGIRGA
jgi:hypothetical protein